MTHSRVNALPKNGTCIVALQCTKLWDKSCAVSSLTWVHDANTTVRGNLANEFRHIVNQTSRIMLWIAVNDHKLGRDMFKSSAIRRSSPHSNYFKTTIYAFTVKAPPTDISYLSNSDSDHNSSMPPSRTTSSKISNIFNANMYQRVCCTYITPRKGRKWLLRQHGMVRCVRVWDRRTTLALVIVDMKLFSKK